MALVHFEAGVSAPAYSQAISLLPPSTSPPSYPQGYIPLVSLKSRQWIGNLKMSGSVCSAAFSADGSELITAG